MHQVFLRLRAKLAPETYPYLLGALFILFFAAPLGLFFWFSSRSGETPANVIPTYTSIKGQGSFIEVGGIEPIAPKAGEDFLILAWIRIGAMPTRGERLLLFSTVDGENPVSPGIALAVYPEGYNLRPVVYWQDESGERQSIQFSELTLPEGAWCAFGLSYRKDKYLGLHAAVRAAHGKPEVRLLGGYQVPAIYPKGIPALRLGAFGDNKFRGAIGPVGIFSGQKLTGKLKHLMRDIADEPGTLPRFFKPEAVRAWALGGGGEASPGTKFERFSPPVKEKPEAVTKETAPVKKLVASPAKKTPAAAVTKKTVPVKKQVPGKR